MFVVFVMIILAGEAAISLAQGIDSGRGDYFGTALFVAMLFVVVATDQLRPRS